jgi:hypothetical protein
VREATRGGVLRHGLLCLSPGSISGSTCYVHDNESQERRTTLSKTDGQCEGRTGVSPPSSQCCTGCLLHNVCRGPVDSKPRRPAQNINNPPNAYTETGGKAPRRSSASTRRQ